jgi:hypothetical protein
MSLEGVSGADYVRSMEMRELGRDEVDLLWTIDRSEGHHHTYVVSLEDANEARDRLVSSGVLERFQDTHGPNVLIDAG